MQSWGSLDIGPISNQGLKFFYRYGAAICEQQGKIKRQGFGCTVQPSAIPRELFLLCIFRDKGSKQLET